jgi:hypothetical protein
MAIVSSTDGSLTSTFWKRRSRAASFSTYLRYSSSVVAPTQCSSPRASAGLSMLPASIAPSALPAPTMVCNSSTNRITRPSCLARSFNTAFSRSSNSPRNFAPAISAPMSRARMRLSLRPSGTSPFTMRCASPSTMAVLPTPGSPIRTGLFLVRRCSTWTVRRISSSRPMTGSSLPCSARSVRSMVYFSSAWRCSSAFGSVIFSPPRTSSMARSMAPLTTPASLRSAPSGPLSSRAASTNSSLEMYWSPRFWASLSVRLRSLPRSFETWTSPPVPSTFGSRSSASPSRERRRLTLVPDFSSNGRTVPPCWSRSASIRWAGSMNWWSRPSAVDWASARAIWNLLVSLSMRMGSGLPVKGG